MADSGSEAGTASCLAISSTPMPTGLPAMLATMRRGTGQLELIAFELVDDGIGPPAINRTGDFTNQADPNVGGTSLAPLEPGRILAALQSGGDLKLTAYSVSPTRATLIRPIAEAGAGATSLIAVEAFSESEALTACRNGSGNLELIGWNTEAGTFAITRGADSGTQAGEVGEVTLALIGRRAVTAVRDGSDNLLLIPWDVPPGLATVDRINPGAHAGEASQIALVALGDSMLVTALRAGSGNLLLISWRLEDDGSIVRLHDSGHQAGEIGQIYGPNNQPVYQPPVALCRIDDGNVITALRNGDGDLLLIGWSVAGDGQFQRWPGDSGNQAGEVTEIAITPFAVGDFATDVVTAVRDGSGDLLLIAWRVSAESGTIERIADSGDEAGAASCLAITTIPMSVGPPVILVTLRRGSDNLELIAFELFDEDLGTPVISRTGDDTNRADTIVGATAVTPLDTGRALVALQLDGTLQLATYGISDASQRLAPADILEIRFDNPVLPDSGDGSWSSNKIGKYPLSSGMEWVQTMAHEDEYDNAELVGASGWAIGPNDSGADVPFDHPFGFDWEFHVALDDAYTALLSQASANDDRIAAAEALGLPVTRGLLGLEWDKGLLPQGFRAQVNHGDRAAVFGRWILDTGHDFGDHYRTEIHPPLLVATASVQPDAAGAESTRVLFMSRPFLPGQRFTVDVGDAYSDAAPDDGTFVDHLVNEIEKVILLESRRVEAHPKIKSRPFKGRHEMHVIVRPPPLADTSKFMLAVSFQFTTRAGCSVRVVSADSDSVDVVLTFDELRFRPPRLPERHDRTYSRDQLDKLSSGAGIDILLVDAVAGLVSALLPWGGLFLTAYVEYILSRGIRTDEYEPLEEVNVLDATHAVMNAPANAIPAGQGIVADEIQPYPVFGWLEAKWVTKRG